LALTVYATLPLGAGAQVPEIFKDADLPLGQKLIKEHACSSCHARKVGGDGSAIYRPAGRINTPGALRGMVDLCSTELSPWGLARKCPRSSRTRIFPWARS
jgi:hypothetical protein